MMLYDEFEKAFKASDIRVFSVNYATKTPLTEYSYHDGWIWSEERYYDGCSICKSSLNIPILYNLINSHPTSYVITGKTIKRSMRCVR